MIAFLADEPGAERVEEILSAADRGRTDVFASFMTYMELLYRVWQIRGEREGKVSYLRLKALPVRRVDVSEGLLLRAARIKASHPVSVADAWIAATAMITTSPLVHKDPEFRPLHREVRLVELPLKPRRAGR